LEQTLSVDSRLVNVGEQIKFSLTVDPALAEEADFRIFPRYLENCDPQEARNCEERLAWLDDIPSVSFDLALDNGHAGFTYTADQPGNFIARFRTPGKTLYRYFAAVTEEYLIYRMQAYGRIEPPEEDEELRNGGFPIDWALDSKNLDIILDPNKGHLKKALEYQEIFDDLILPWFSSMLTDVKNDPCFDISKRVDAVLDRMQQAGFRIGRAVVDWEAHAEAVEEYQRRGFEVMDGIIAEDEIHRGAPWFPYWMSEDDFLSPAEGPTDKLGMIMDFCAGFHFHGPPSFHMLASECSWEVAAPHADLAAREHVLIVKNSGGGPVVVPTLFTYEYRPWGTWPKRDWSRQRQLKFAREFLNDTAFEHARKYPIVFARCTDIADYMRKHPTGVQPRRVLSSITHDWPYDRIWSPEWVRGIDAFCDVRSFNDSLYDIRGRWASLWAKPGSRELIYYEDSRHNCRFEYACPKPILWYAYDDHRRAGKWCGRPELEVPDPQISMETKLDERTFELCYKIQGGTQFPNYKLAVWDIPREFAEFPFKTNAEEFILVRNSEGDYRGILLFDLKSDMELRLSFTKK
jgi:hypothetical protein